VILTSTSRPGISGAVRAHEREIQNKLQDQILRNQDNRVFATNDQETVTSRSDTQPRPR
jgi:hypothetical protein